MLGRIVIGGLQAPGGPVGAAKDANTARAVVVVEHFDNWSHGLGLVVAVQQVNVDVDLAGRLAATQKKSLKGRAHEPTRQRPAQTQLGHVEPVFCCLAGLFLSLAGRAREYAR